MTFLPIVARELRVASRRRSTYWIRAGAALVVMATGVWFFLMMHREPPTEIAQVLFGIFTGCAVLFCLLSGVRSTADTISEEKREGTLGLLFLTDLKGYDVVLGKLAATSINEVYCVLAVVPMLAIPLLMGGITPGEFGRMAIVAINTLFFSLCLGLCVSSVSRSARKAFTGTLIMLLVFSAALPALGAWHAEASGVKINPVFLFPSPGFTYFSAWDRPFTSSSQGFWYSLAVIHGLAWLFLILAGVGARRSWQDKPAGAGKLRWRERWKAWSHGNHAQRSAFRRRLLDTNAFYWLAARARLKPALVWAVLGLLACGWAFGWVQLQEEWLNPGIYCVTAAVLGLLMKSWFASEVGRQIVEDRKNGALELLLSTPLTIQDILRGQRLALQRQFLGPVALALLVTFILMIIPGQEVLDRDERGIWDTLWLLSMLAFVADLVALYWVGLWQGLASRHPNRAAGASFARIVIVPTLGFALLCSATAVTAMNGSRTPGWPFYAGWWFGLGFAADLLFATLARQKLLAEFRLLAAQRYIPRAGFWQRFWGGSGASSPNDTSL